MKERGFDKKAEKIIKDIGFIQDRSLNTLSYIDGFDVYFDSKIPNLITLFIIFYMGILLIAMEKQTNMTIINQLNIVSLRYQRMAEYISLSIAVTVTALLVETIFFISSYSFNLLSGFNLPIYQIPSLAFFPLGIKIYQAVLLHSLVKLPYFIFLGLLSAYLTSKTRDILGAFLINIIGLVVLYLSGYFKLLPGIRSNVSQNFLLIIVILVIYGCELANIKWKKGSS